MNTNDQFARGQIRTQTEHSVSEENSRPQFSPSQLKPDGTHDTSVAFRFFPE